MPDDKRSAPRPKGRPRGEPQSTVTAWIPARLHDGLIKLANDKGESVSTTIRTILEREVKPG